MARGEWLRLAPELVRLGLLTGLDIAVFTVLCVTLGHWLECEAEIEASRGDPAYPTLLAGPLGKMATQYARDAIKFGNEFGLSASARCKLRAEAPEDHGKFAGLLAGADDD